MEYPPPPLQCAPPSPAAPSHTEDARLCCCGDCAGGVSEDPPACVQTADRVIRVLAMPECKRSMNRYMKAQIQRRKLCPDQAIPCAFVGIRILHTLPTYHGKRMPFT